MIRSTLSLKQTGVVGALLLSCFAGSTASISAASTPPFNPQLKSFYSPPSPLPKGQPGAVIRKERVTALSDDLQGVKVWRVIYHSRGLKGQDIAVSGVVLAPSKALPKSGLPIIAWAHGTTGDGDGCAPSARADLAAYAPLLRRYVQAGYVIAATDYEGIGVPGIHPYLNGVSEGRSVIDSVRAARTVLNNRSKTWVTVGHSQGGHAALFAGELAHSWGKGLNFRGVASIAPASHLSLIPDLAPYSGTQGFYLMMLQGLLAQEPNLQLSGLIGSEALSKFSVVSEGCNGDVAAAYQNVPKTQFIASNQATLKHVKALLAKNEPGRQRTTQPIFVQQGQKDTIVPPIATNNLTADLRAERNKVQYKTYKQADHITVLLAGLPDLVSWLKRRLG